MHTRHARQTLCATLIASILATAGGCSGRRVGQVEMFQIGTNDGKISVVGQTIGGEANYSAGNHPEVRLRKDVEGTWDDYIMYRDDVIAVQVQSAYLNRIPHTLTGSHDIILFAEVWENAAQGYNSQAINTIVYAAQSQMIPSRLNFTGNLAFGPAAFSGHPFKIKFTLMILQKRTGEQASSSIGVIQNFMSASSAATPYSAIASQAVSVLREVLRNQPDVVAFDFEATLPSISPRELNETALQAAQKKAIEIAAKTATENPNLETAKWLDNEIELLKPSVVGELRKPLIESQTELRKSMDKAAAAFEAALRTNVENITISPAPSTDSRESATNVGSRGDRIVKFPSVQNASDSSNVLHLYELEKIGEKLNQAVTDQEKRKKINEAIAAASADLKKSFQDAAAAAKNSAEAVIPKVVIRDVNRIDRTLSSGDKLMPWLKYGYYAVVETDSRSEEVPELQLGWEHEYRLHGGRIVKGSNQSLDASLQANYLIFSITPGQLAESPEILAAASEANAQLLKELRQPFTTSQALSKVQESTVSLQQSILRARIERASREIAIGIKKSEPDPKKAFEDQHKALRETNGAFDKKFFAGLKDGEALNKYIDEIFAEQQTYWIKRILETRSQ